MVFDMNIGDKIKLEVDELPVWGWKVVILKKEFEIIAIVDNAICLRPNGKATVQWHDKRLVEKELHGK